MANRAAEVVGAFAEDDVGAAGPAWHSAQRGHGVVHCSQAISHEKINQAPECAAYTSDCL